jgi:hypothetical protein
MFRNLLSKSILANPTAAIESKKIRQAAQAINVDRLPSFLNESQRDLKRVRTLAKAVNQLSELECANLLSRESEVCQRVVDIVSQLASLDKPNAANPTRRELLDSVVQSVREEKPLQMYASLCLEKGSGLRDGKLRWFLNGEKSAMPNNLATSACIKGWARVNEIMQKIDYPVKVTFLLGDLDYAVVDGCCEWCEPEWEEVLSRDTDKILEDTRKIADTYFGPDKGVEIKKWSSVYSCKDILTEVPRAEILIDSSRSPAIVKDSLVMYKQQWGYSSLARQLGIDDDKLDSFILGDVQRMAAQYRVESNYIQRCNGIQLWCESVPNPGWPIEISNFDGSGYVASLIME